MQKNRRNFIKTSGLIFTGSTGFIVNANEMEMKHFSANEVVKFGLITDLHHADKPPAGTRYYRETMPKFAEASAFFQSQKPDFLVELGDLIDAADSVETELKYLKQINREFEKAAGKRYYVLGNHCVDTLKKSEFLGEIGQNSSYFSFDSGGWHFIILDACFRADGVGYERRNFDWTDANIPKAELEWLNSDLNSTKLPTIVFAHQRVDEAGNHRVKNAPEVRKILENSGLVKAVFQGHSHQNAIQQINGINFVTMAAMIEGNGLENSGYSMVRIDSENNIIVEGFRRQADYNFKK